MNLDYFKKKELQVLFQALKEKYVNKGNLTGIISLNIKTEGELKEIEKFIRNGKILNLGINKVKIVDIEKSILQSKYSGISLLEILEFLFGSITTKEEKKNKQAENDKILVQEFKEYFNNSFVDYLIYFENKKIITLLNKDKNLIYNVMKAILNLPSKPVRLNVFATVITKDPHYFDVDTKNFNMFMKYLTIYGNFDYPNTREKTEHILNNYNLFTDTFSNTVMIYNIYGEDYLDILAKREEVVVLNLDNINKLKKLYTLNKKVLIVENPSILSDLDKTRFGIIVTNGNPNLAVYEVLDKLIEHEFYYNGDFDPEGLLIADRLKNRYKNLKLLFYDGIHFEKCASDKVVTDSRIKKLDNIKSKDLEIIKNAIFNSKKVGYQERLIDDIHDYIKE